MKIFDVSYEISENMPTYKNKKQKRPKKTVTSSIKKSTANESRWNLDSHTGTHVDSFKHFLDKGKTIEKLDLDYFYGKCKVFDLKKIKEKITRKDLEKLSIKKNMIVLLKTKNSFKNKTRFDFNFVYLEKSGAEFLAQKKIKTLGIDSLGIERNQPKHETHKILFRNKIVVVEGLRLKNVNSGEYIFACFPLKLKGSEASPVRAVLIK